METSKLTLASRVTLAGGGGHPVYKKGYTFFYHTNKQFLYSGLPVSISLYSINTR